MTLSYAFGLLSALLGHLKQIGQTSGLRLKRMALIVVCILLDAALIPLIEDLFKELAMIEACNKVGNETLVNSMRKSLRNAPTHKPIRILSPQRVGNA